MYKMIIILLSMGLTLSASTVDIDKDYSNVQVIGRYLDTVDMHLTFDDYSAEFDVSNGKINKITVRFKRDSINTGNEERNDYIKSKIVKIPTMKLTLTRITSKQAQGSLFVNGVKRPVMFTVKNLKVVQDPKNPRKKVCAIQLSSLIRRRDFQLTDSSTDDVISPSLKVTLNLVAQI